MSPVGRTAPVLEMLMIEPPSPAAIRSPMSADSRNGPLRFTPTTLSKSSSLTSASVGYSGDTPALLTRTSTRPNSSYAASTSRSRSSQRPTWQAPASARPPAARSSAATSSHACCLPARHHDVGARRRERARDREPQPARASGDERHSAGEVEHRRASFAGFAAMSAARAGRSPLTDVRRAGRRRPGAAGRRRQRHAAPASVSSKTEPPSPIRSATCAAGEQQLEVADDLPHDQQRLLGHGARGPQAAGDRERAYSDRRRGSPGCARSGGVLVQARVHQPGMVGDRRTVAGQQPRERHRGGAPRPSR